MTFRRSRFTPSFEGLETKLPPTGGITLVGSMLSIVATQSTGNTASVAIDSTNGNVRATLDGVSQEFAASQILAVYYQGGMGGGDTFANRTSILSIDYGFGGNNNITGGTGQDFVFVFGDGNTVHDSGGVAVAYTHGGHDTIDSGILVF